MYPKKLKNVAITAVAYGGSNQPIYAVATFTLLVRHRASYRDFGTSYDGSRFYDCTGCLTLNWKRIQCICQWIAMDSYCLWFDFAGFLMLSGRVGDIYGPNACTVGLVQSVFIYNDDDYDIISQ